MSATEYRAQFDAVVTFANGGGLRTEGFRIDVPGPEVSPQEVARLFITSLNLTRTDLTWPRCRWSPAPSCPRSWSARPAPARARSMSSARWLAEHGARLVGIDSVNIDNLQSGGHRPAHSLLLRAGIPVVEHLTGLSQLPPTGFWFSAAPIPIASAGTFPVRAYATIPE